LLAVIRGSPVVAADAGSPATLASRDRVLVTQAACADAGAAQLDAYALRKGTSSLRVEVQCNPQRVEATVPVAETATCTNSSGSWRCQPGQQLLQVTLPNDHLLSVVAEGVPASVAVEAVTEASRLTIRPFYRPAAKVLTGRCTVLRGAAAARAGMDNFRINCGEASVFLTRDCFQGKCRYFIPFALNY
jgi:hypothetical protein